MKKVYKLLALFCILNLGDYLTTILALGNGATESNIIARHFVENGNLHWFKIIGLTLLITYVVLRARKGTESQVRISKLFKWINVSYVFVIMINIATYTFCSVL